MKIAFLYAVFAVVATSVNVGTQAVVFFFWGTEEGVLWLALVAGTGSGLVVKYVLDKLWIFRYRVEGGFKEDARLFARYALLGVLTTAVFWGTEIAFDAITGSEWGRYTGGVLGLAAGYILKFRLDRKYVFCDKGHVR